MDTIARPFGWVFMQLYNLCGNYGVAIILFALLVRLVLLPFSMKSKRSMMQTTRLNPRLQALEKKYEGNKEKYQEEVAKIYKEEKINPLSGCIWTLIPFPILLALYRAIRFPITITMGVSQEAYAVIKERLAELGFSLGSGTYTVAYEQIYESQFITEHFSDFAGISDKLAALDYTFLGMDLGSVPQWQIWTFFGNGQELWPQLGLFLIPIASTILSYLSTYISQKMNGTASQTQGNMKTMMIMMPLISLWIGFALPGALGLYWTAGTFFSIIQDAVLTMKYKKVFDALDAERIERERIREEELEKKRQETELLRAQNATTVNPNTSKKKIQAKEKQKETERQAAAERERKNIEREPRGGDSRVGERPYARGRAYVADRYKNGYVAAEPEPEAPVTEELELDVVETVVPAAEPELTAAVFEEERPADEEAEIEEYFIEESFIESEADPTEEEEND